MSVSASHGFAFAGQAGEKLWKGSTRCSLSRGSASLANCAARICASGLMNAMMLTGVTQSRGDIKMTDASSAIPPDDPNRKLTVADPDSPGRRGCRSSSA